MIPTFVDPNLQTELRSPGELPTLDANFSSPYRLDTTEVDFNLARKLYYNRDENYKLGAGFARPAIDVPVGFMGVPILNAADATDDLAQEWLDKHMKAWAGQVSKAHKMALRDGEVLVRLVPKNRSSAYGKLFTDDDKDLDLILIPTEAYEVITADEDIDSIDAIKIKHVFMRPDGNRMREVVLYETITATQILLKYENDEEPPRELPNPMGFIPAVVMENESESGQLHASSELEPIEPYLKFYNDVMLHAGSSSQLHSTAKLVIRARNIERFLAANFTTTEVTERRLRFKNKDVLFFESGDPSLVAGGANIYSEGADIIQAKAPLGDTTTLLEFIFLNIVDVSEVPEWAFGGAIASSKASVGEQSSPLVHKVIRKRTMVEEAWALLGRMMLKTVLNKQVRVEVSWDTLGMRDLKTEGEAFRNFAEAIIALNDGQMVSKHTSLEVLRKIVKEILPYDIDDSRVESDMLEAEVEEKMEQAKTMMDAQKEQFADEDKQTGLNVVERDSGTDPS
jgi:Phage portal protein, SPP1 Gp6-like.